MSKKLKYRATREDELIDISFAFSQAAALLDKAAEMAKVNNDAELMLKVADRWITIGSLFASAEEEPKEHLDTNSKSKYGFGPVEEGVEEDE